MFGKKKKKLTDDINQEVQKKEEADIKQEQNTKAGESSSAEVKDEKAELSESAAENQEVKATPVKKKKSFWKRNKFWINLLIKLVVIAGIAYAVFTYVFGIYRMEGNNMYPAVRDGDLCITYKLDPYNTGDVVVYDYKDGYRFGRITARGGEEYNIDELGPIINGTHASEEIFYPTEAGDYPMPINVAKDELLIMNDYRDDMNDGRTWGPVKTETVHGKVVFVFRVRGF